MNDKKPSNLTVGQKGGVVHETINQLKLIARLMGDSRVSIFTKLIPLGALIYLISPVDLLPGVALPVIGALDDAAILWLGSYVFTELCPPAVVQEHMKALSSNLNPAAQDDIVDAEATDISDKQP
jgi:uncharacterized membrane protein YkvA (DUF1232 family)